MVVDLFRKELETLELQRLRVVRDRKAYLFMILTASLLGVVSLASAVIGLSKFPLILAVLLLLGSVVLERLRGGLDEDYQNAFRKSVTRAWFHGRFPQAYLSDAVGSQAIARSASGLVIDSAPTAVIADERILFEADSFDIQVLILRQKAWLTAKPRRWSLLWYRTRNAHGDQTVVVRGAKPVAPSGALSEVHHTLLTFAPGRAASVAINASGIWASVPLRTRLFEAPVLRSCLDPEAYSSWDDDAKLPLNVDVRHGLRAFF